MKKMNKKGDIVSTRTLVIVVATLFMVLAIGYIILFEILPKMGGS
ncbi:hypothetical protein ACFL0V_04810 [Nanoarchaeota archaeon]